MPAKTVIICDNCNRNLESSQGVEHRLMLHAEKILCTSMFIPAVHVPPPVEGVACFCDLVCLREWLEEKP